MKGSVFLSRYIALVPAYEPDELMLGLLRELSEADFYTVVIDDGSGERFAPLFEEAKKYATVLTHPQNMGKGQGIRTGLAHINETFSEDCVVVTVDADGQHKVPDAEELCRLAENSPDTLWLGSRKFTGNVPFRSRFGNWMTRLVYMLSTGTRVYDTQTGLRAFSGGLIPRMLETKGNRYEYEMNILLEFAREGRPIKEMEIETIYLNNNEGSHFNPFKDSFRIYKEILKFSASSMLAFCVDYIVFTVVLLLSGNNIYLSNIIARLISSITNFTVNKRLVFKKKGGLLKSAVGYFLLAAAILVGNTVVLALLTHFGVNEFIAKLITELAFFVVSWAAQKFIIFGKSKKR